MSLMFLLYILFFLFSKLNWTENLSKLNIIKLKVIPNYPIYNTIVTTESCETAKIHCVLILILFV